MVADARVQHAFRVIDQASARSRADLIELTQIPAPPFAEERRARRFAELLREAGADSVHIDDEGNVLAVRRGTGGGRAVALDGHLDTVFPEGTDVTVRLRGDTLFAPLRREVKKRAFKPAVEACEIVPGILTAAGVVGAVAAYKQQD